MLPQVDQFRPPFGDLVTATLALAALIALLWLYLIRQRDATRARRTMLIIFRAAAIAIVAWVLFGPSKHWGKQTTRVRLPVVFLPDTSISMKQVDVANPAPREGEDPERLISRFDALRRTWLDPDYQRELEAIADVRRFGFDSGIRAMGIDETRSIEPSGPATLMYEGLQQGVGRMLQGSVGEEDAGDVATSGIAVLLTDAHDTQRSGDAGLGFQLRELGWTVYGVPVGSSRSIRDIAVNAWSDADFLFEEQATWINASITQTGFEHRQVRVELLREGKRIDNRIVDFGADATKQIRFKVKPPKPEKYGQRVEGYRVVASVVPLETAPTTNGEKSEEDFLDNNERWVFLQVSTDRIRIAMFEAQPYWDTKFLARVMRADPQIELTSVYALATGRTVTVQSNVREGSAGDNTSEKDYDPLWLTQAKLNEFDIIILGKGAEKFFGGYRAQWLVDFVEEQGGSLVLARGQPFTITDSAGFEASKILAGIEPVTWGTGAYRNLKLKLTRDGQVSPLLIGSLKGGEATLTELPDMLAATRIQKEKAMSIVLLRQEVARGNENAPPMAAVAYRNAGQGRVLAVLTDGLWQWSFLPSTLKQHDTVYQGFWARTLRWLSTGGQFLPGQGMSLGLSRLKAEPGENVDVTVTTRFIEDETFKPQITITEPDGEQRAIELTRTGPQSTRYVGSIRAGKPGVHEIVLVGQTTAEPDDGSSSDGAAEPITIKGRLAVYEESDEKRDPSARPQLLKALCEATGGRCLELDQRDALPKLLDDLWQAQQKDEKMTYIFNEPLVFALVATLFGLEWFVRRRGAMM